MPVTHCRVMLSVGDGGTVVVGLTAVVVGDSFGATVVAGCSLVPTGAAASAASPRDGARLRATGPSSAAQPRAGRRTPGRAQALARSRACPATRAAGSPSWRLPPNLDRPSQRPRRPVERDGQHRFGAP